MLKLIVFIWSVAFSTLGSGALVPEPCEKLTTPTDVMRCASENGVKAKLGAFQLEAADANINAAGQIPNPELELSTFRDPDGNSTSEVGIFHTFELGGKKQAREDLARGQKGASAVELRQTKESIAIDTVVRLYRLRQIQDELDIAQETFTTFKNVSAQFEKAGRLTPEQEVSISVFKLAEEESKLKLSSLKNEQQKIITEISTSLGFPFKIEKALIPPAKKNWQDLSPGNLATASDLKIAESDVEVAKARYQLEETQAWPDLTVGPKVEIVSGESQSTRVGVALSVPLPLYHRNSGGRLAALKELKRNELALDVAKSSLASKISYLSFVYDQAAKVLRSVSQPSVVKNRHAAMHTLLKRGIVSAPMVIELHRQIFEFYENLHEQELKAIEALWSIYALQGKILAEVVQ